MRKYLPIVGAVCVSLGFCMASGVDRNEWQALYALILMGAGAWCFNRADRMSRESEKKQSNETTIGSVHKDAA
ncbi:MAG: hypothetical protein J5732_02640 [Bacteroidaceae bacterium]|nr:hypothetical protein [Bacteroidaceae bacterium]